MNIVQTCVGLKMKKQSNNEDYKRDTRMKNYGQINRKIKIKKRYTLSPYVLNLTDEAKKWATLRKRLRKRIRANNV